VIDMARTLRMDEKELREARIVGIPEYIVGKFSQGVEPTEIEKDMINKYGKEYVSVHTRDGKRVRPHLRNLNGVAKVRSCPRREADNPIPRGFREESKDVMVEKMYSGAVGDYNFDIPTKEEVYDDYLKDWIGAIGQDVEGTIDVLKDNKYSEREIRDILEDLNIHGEVRLPRPVKLEAEYFVYD